MEIMIEEMELMVAPSGAKTAYQEIVDYFWENYDIIVS